MNQTAQLILALIFLFAPGLCTTGCGPESGVGTFVYNYTPPPPDMAKSPRLSVAKDGTITDSLLNNEPCQWMYNRGCEKRCFPVEPMFPVCEDNGKRHYYTRQGLFKVFAYGRTSTIADASCQGQTTNVLYQLSIIPDQVKGKFGKVRPCDGVGDLSLTLYDRVWYDVILTDLLPASVDDLPPENKER